MVFGFAVLSAFGFALASVGQYRASRGQSRNLNLSFGLLSRLLRTSDFLWSMGFDAVGVISQFVALSFGPISVVQPVLSLGLVLAVYIERKMAQRRLSLSEILAMLGIGASLSLFVVLRGIEAHDRVSALWSIAISVGVLVIAGAVQIYSRWKTRQVSSMVLAAISALLLGCATVLEREVGLSLARGLLHPLLTWQLWALVAIAPIALLYVQSTFQVGALSVVLPLMTVGEPLFAMGLGRIMVGENFLGRSSVAGSFGALLVLVVCLLVLAMKESDFRGHLPKETRGGSSV